MHRDATVRTVEGERGAATGVAADIAGVEVGVRIIQRKADDAVIARPLAPDVERLVGQVEDGRTALAQAFEDLALGLDDLLRAAELADVGGTGVVDDDHLRPGQADGVADLADARGTQFDHCGAVLRGDLQQGQRCAEVVVEVATGGMHRPAGTQDRGEHFLDRGLAAGAGDGHHRLVEGCTIQRAELAKRHAAVGDHQLRQVDIGDFALDQRGDGPFGLHIGQVVMAIEARPAEGDEQLTGSDAAAVDADAGETGVGACQACVQCSSQLAEHHRLKHVEPPRRQGPSRLRPDRRSHGARH